MRFERLLIKYWNKYIWFEKVYVGDNSKTRYFQKFKTSGSYITTYFQHRKQKLYDSVIIRLGVSRNLRLQDHILLHIFNTESKNYKS